MLINRITIPTTGLTDGFININLSSNYSTETQQYEQIENNFDITSEEIINPIVDYEKVKLSPVGISGETSISVDALKFKLYFTNKTGWDSDFSGDLGPTKLLSLGFTEDDIYNRRKKIDKTFIRLSFYDTNNLNTQNLLYYSTIYLDSNAIYAKYVKNNRDTDTIRAEFMSENPKLSRKIKSFEGYNIYLFKNDIPKTYNEDNPKIIYMRVEYNSAVDGRSLLFITDTAESPLGATMNELYSKMFYEVKCWFDGEQYVYTIENKPLQINVDSEDENIREIIEINTYQAKVI